MNKYLENLNRIEFVVTMACTGRCIHCSEGEHKSSGKHIDGDIWELRPLENRITMILNL